MQVAGVNGVPTQVGQLLFNAVARARLQSQRRKQSKSFDVKTQPNVGVDAFAE